MRLRGDDSVVNQQRVRYVMPLVARVMLPDTHQIRRLVISLQCDLQVWCFPVQSPRTARMAAKYKLGLLVDPRIDMKVNSKI